MTIKEPFARWLLHQAGEETVIGELAATCAQDAAFPRNGDFERVQTHLLRAGADDEIMNALEEARLDWLPGDLVACDVILTAAQKDAVLDGALRDWLVDHCVGGVAGHTHGGFFTLRFEREEDATAFRKVAADLAKNVSSNP